MHALRRTLATACLLGALIAAPALAQQWVNPRLRAAPARLPRPRLPDAEPDPGRREPDHRPPVRTPTGSSTARRAGGRSRTCSSSTASSTRCARSGGSPRPGASTTRCWRAKDGSIYIGTGLNVLAPVKLTREFPVAIEAIEHQLWKDIKAVYQGYEGGHIYRYDPKTGDTRTYTNDDPSPLEDLGIPVPGNTVYAMTWNPDRTVLYGLSYPDAHFFVFDVATRKTRDLGDVVKRKVFSGPERDWRTVPRALYCDPGTGPGLLLGRERPRLALRPGHGPGRGDEHAPPGRVLRVAEVDRLPGLRVLRHRRRRPGLRRRRTTGTWSGWTSSTRRSSCSASRASSAACGR